jgi:RNA polymerase sigma factor (TIGR02999 family)
MKTIGESAPIGELLAARYGELRHVARRLLRRESRGHTLQPTALVHEAWLRLARQSGRQALPPAEFLGAASGAMRLVLVDHARARRCRKRGGDRERVELVVAERPRDATGGDLLALGEALEQLAAVDAELARLVELRCFAGLDEQEIAAARDVSTRTIRRQWRVAKMFLARVLGGTPA